MDITKLKDKIEPYKVYAPGLFFGLGFLFDIVTFSRIDDPLSIFQQGLFLIIIQRILFYRLLSEQELWEPTGRLAQVWKYQNEALHFLLGGLLSLYTIFYFVSASLATSLIFLVFMLAVLVVNELPAFQKQSTVFKVSLYQVCLFSFFALIMPMILSSVSLWTLLLAAGMTALVAYSSCRTLIKSGMAPVLAKRIQMVPVAAVLGVILSLYVLKLLPPLPISVQYMGVYHSVERKDDKYVLSYRRPFYKFWENGAQSFEAAPGENIILFARVFSPAHLDDKIVFQWEVYLNDEWKVADKVSIEVRGGRAEGFRAYSRKSNFDEGEWRVKLLTLDGRELGRIGFDVERVLEADDDFKQDIH